MFRLTKRLIGLLTVNGSNHTKCIFVEQSEMCDST